MDGHRDNNWSFDIVNGLADHFAKLSHRCLHVLGIGWLFICTRKGVPQGRECLHYKDGDSVVITVIGNLHIIVA